MVQKQTSRQKQAEIYFRKKLQAGNFKDAEPSDTDLLKELKARNKKSLLDFKTLKQQGHALSPFLEIGAERGQRALLLSSKFNATGYILDLSLESLKQTKSLSNKLHLPKIPAAVCADAYNLPFKNNCISFIFIYQTLHHFPNPHPILKEAKRLLKKDGTLFFNEEPIKQSLNLNLWRRPTKLRWWEKLLKQFGVLHFISQIGKSETDAGILETSFDLKTWEKALNEFNNVEVALTVFPFGPTTTISKTKYNKPGWLNSSVLVSTLVKVLGGNIQAICQN